MTGAIFATTLKWRICGPKRAAAYGDLNAGGG